MYKIVRFTFNDNHPDNHKVIESGLTLEEAQEHCGRDDTREAGVWFDGYEEEQTMSKYQNPYIDCPECGDHESFQAINPEIGAEEGGNCQSCDHTIETPQWLSATGKVFGRDYL